MRNIKIHLGWLPVYSFAVALGILSMHSGAGLFVAPVAAIAVLATGLSLVPRLQFLRLVGHAAATLIVGLFVVMFLIYPVVAPVLARSESKRLLSGARDSAQRQQEVGSLGMLFTYTNGEWIAIRYLDSHVWPGWSSATALDSDKQLYESRHHFCGRFRAYRRAAMRQRDFNAELAAMGDTNTIDLLSGFEDIHALASASGLQTAVPLLLDLEFRRLDD